MNAWFRHVERMADTFFNGRPERNPFRVTIAELIARKTSTVSYDGKLYRVTVTELEMRPKEETHG